MFSLTVWKSSESLESDVVEDIEEERDPVSDNLRTVTESMECSDERLEIDELLSTSRKR